MAGHVHTNALRLLSPWSVHNPDELQRHHCSLDPLQAFWSHFHSLQNGSQSCLDAINHRKGFDFADGWLLVMVLTPGRLVIGVGGRRQGSQNEEWGAGAWGRPGEEKKTRKKIRVIQPAACQRCPLEMINGSRLWWTESLLFIEITS